MASAELEGWGDEEDLKTAYGQGHLYVESASDHLYGLTRLLQEPAATIACWTCTRGSLEAAAFASWIFSPSIGASKRVARSMSLRFHAVAEDVKFARATGRKNDLKLSSERLTHIIQQAEKRSIEVFWHKKKPVAVGVRVPSATDLIRKVFGDEGAYRLTSAVAHSRSNILAQSSFRQASADDPLLLTKGISNASVAWLLMLGVEALSRSTWARAQLFGHDTSALKSILEDGFDEVGLKSSLRFWRS